MYCSSSPRKSKAPQKAPFPLTKASTRAFENDTLHFPAQLEKTALMARHVVRSCGKDIKNQWWIPVCKPCLRLPIIRSCTFLSRAVDLGTPGTAGDCCTEGKYLVAKWNLISSVIDCADTLLLASSIPSKTGFWPYNYVMLQH